jgi:alkylated DNA repair dioxygenase AlkB
MLNVDKPSKHSSCFRTILVNGTGQCDIKSRATITQCSKNSTMQQSLFKLDTGINLLPFDGEALFYPNFLSFRESEECFSRLFRETHWRQMPIKIYDKEMMQPRLSAFFGISRGGLDFSGAVLPVQDWTLPLSSLKLRTEEIAGVVFSHALLNLYRNGKDSVSWHRDNEESWGEDPVIGSVSLGAARTFQLRNYKDKSIMRSIELTPGSLLVMKGAIQRCWEHQVPKVNKRLGPRINITFRVLK